MDSPAPLPLPLELPLPAFPAFRPLPPEDPAFSKDFAARVEEAGLHLPTPPERNPDRHEEWSSLCLVDVSRPLAPRVAGWRAENFVYPAGASMLFALAEAARRIAAQELDPLEKVLIKPHNWSREGPLRAGEEVRLAELLYLSMATQDGTAHNELIDLLDRVRVSLTVRALGLRGSDLTRKFLPRQVEDPGFEDAPGTYSCARHLATVLWAGECGVFGGGRGRSVFRGALSCNTVDYFAPGLHPNVTILSKSGAWSAFTAEAALIEDGPLRYILAAIVPRPASDAETRLAVLARGVHWMLREGRASSSSF